MSDKEVIESLAELMDTLADYLEAILKAYNER